MKRKRILLIQNNISFGGTSSLILFIAKHLSDLYDFDLFCFEDNAPEKEKEFLSYGGKIIKCSKINYNKRGLKGRLISYWQRFSGKVTRVFGKVLQETNYYAVHCFEDLSSGYYLKAAKMNGVQKRIVHFNIDHTVVKSSNPINWFLLKKEMHLIRKYANIFAAVSSQSTPASIKNNNEITVINNPIDSKYIYNDFIPKNLCILQVGTFNDNKNQLFSLEVLKTLVYKYKLSDAKLTMIGQQLSSENNYLEMLNNKISELRLSENVVILGPSNNPERFYKDNSILIFPSKKEAFGLVLVEAQACGMYCFSSTAASKDTDLGGVYFLKLNDGYEKWAEAIFNYYKSPNYSKTKYDSSKYSCENIRKEYINIYEKNA